ncbi:EAL domain-containing protein [Caldichromatium japonicum]|uniref:EAL domain-containing protein n=1 Tax=Caldichromatium japonicum TaxID=2699430 RepID=A0A6G7VD01_9GAMM|nr:EAL domain-containing protein [Caldichromatium japonicum]QIK37667.1 EAL domain-containing protein [Caldichromatium japonicum]
MFPDDIARVALEYTPVEVYWLDLDGRIIQVNAAAVKALGYSCQEIIGLNIWDIDTRYSMAAWRAFIEFLQKNNGNHSRIESFHRRRDGSLYPVEVNAFLIEGLNGPLVCGFAQDISARRQAEESLQASEERLRTLINSSPDIICFKDREGRWLEANTADLELFCLTGVDYRGKTDCELATETHPCYRDAFLCCEASDERAWQANGLSRGEEVIRRPDGSVKVYDVTKVPLFEPDGRRKGLVVLGRDITERKQTEESLREERRFLQAVIDSIDDPILVISADCQLLRANQAARRFFIETEKVAANEDRWHCAMRFALARRHERLCNASEHECPVQAAHKNPSQRLKLTRSYWTPHGAEVHYEVVFNPLLGENGEVCAIIEVWRNISEHIALLNTLRAREQSYIHLAHHDPLTRLPNRLLFNDRLNQTIHASHRHGRRFAVLFIDLDRFKQINDSFDHSYGDQLLFAVAERLQQLFREDDTLARLGGDEFIVILTDIHQAEDAAIVAAKILHEIKQPFVIQGHQLLVGASIGIALYPEHGTTAEELVRNADAAMYRAKESGRNGFQYYSQELTARAFDRIPLESGLYYAIERGEFCLHYQPQFNLQSRRLRGIEALLRWQHPELGMVSPATFIPLAEESNLILRIGEWVLVEACRQMKDWLEHGLFAGDNLMSVNLSPKQFDHPDLVASIARILSESGLPAHQLELEITEATLMRAPEQAIDVLFRLRELGVKVAIDDFGTGYSSLIQLKRVPLTTLKIDRSFVTGLPYDSNDVAISRAVIALAQDLCLEVLAEGIETEVQHNFLICEGCLNGQGYLLSPPLEVSDLQMRLADWQAAP